MDYFLIIPAVLALALIIWLTLLTIRLNRFMRGRKAKNLEGAIIEIIENLQILESATERIENRLTQFDERLKHKVHHVKTVRFNPFADQGGNHSFATALLDEEGSGVVLSSLYSRERVNVYAKPVQKLTSDYELSREEKLALTAASDE